MDRDRLFVLAGWCLGAVLLLSLAPWPTSRAAAGDPPSWREGQSWVYDATDFETGDRFTITVTVVRVNATEALLRSNHTYGTFWSREDTVLSLPTMGVRSWSEVFSNGRRSAMSYDPPWRWLSFPLEAGKTWRSVSSVDGLATYSYNYTVLPPTSTASPAGTFMAFPVEQDSMGIPLIALKSIFPGFGRAVMYYSGDVGNLVRYEAFDDAGAEVAEASLTAPAAPVPLGLILASATAAAATAVAAVVLWRRRARRRAATQGPRESEKPS